jgi:hypothetical protein
MDAPGRLNGLLEGWTDARGEREAGRKAAGTAEPDRRLDADQQSSIRRA